jgi:hypothetical protein
VTLWCATGTEKIQVTLAKNLHMSLNDANFSDLIIGESSSAVKLSITAILLIHCAIDWNDSVSGFSNICAR